MKRNDIIMYEVMESVPLIDDYGYLHSYGILCTQIRENGAKHTMRVLPDISTDRNKVNSMVWLFNLICMTPDNLQDVVVGLIS